MTKEKRERRPRKTKTPEAETKTVTDLDSTEAEAIKRELPETPAPTEPILESKAADSSESFSLTLLSPSILITHSI